MSFEIYPSIAPGSRSHMHNEIQPYESLDDEEASSEDGGSSVFVRVWSCPGELMVPSETPSNSEFEHRAFLISHHGIQSPMMLTLEPLSTQLRLQGLSTAGTAPPHLTAFGQDYSSVQPAPTEINISGIAPANQRYQTSAQAAAAASRGPSQRKALGLPCGSLSSCGLLSILALCTAGAWTFAGLCIHRQDSTDAVDVVWEKRMCTVLGLTDQPDQEAGDCCVFSVATDGIAGEPVQRRLLSRHALSLDGPLQSSTSTGAGGNATFVDEADAPLNGPVPSSQAAAPNQESGQQTDQLKIVSAQACTRDLKEEGQQSPCDAFLQRVQLDSNNAYQCLVHLDNDALSFEDLAKTADSAFFLYESFELTNALPYPDERSAGMEDSCVEAFTKGNTPRANGMSILEGTTALITGIVVAVLFTLTLLSATAAHMRQASMEVIEVVEQPEDAGTELSPGPELQLLHPSSGRNSVNHDTHLSGGSCKATGEANSSKAKVKAGIVRQDTVAGSNQTVPQDPDANIEPRDDPTVRRHSV